jgi:hypothetical protein
MSRSETGNTWTFVTSHTQVLLCLAKDPSVRLRDVAETVGITERAAQRIVRDLDAAGYVEREWIGRRNQDQPELADAPCRPTGPRDWQLLNLLKPDRPSKPAQTRPRPLAS